jgi:hypothetical protein
MGESSIKDQHPLSKRNTVLVNGTSRPKTLPIFTVSVFLNNYELLYFSHKTTSTLRDKDASTLNANACFALPPYSGAGRPNEETEVLLPPITGLPLCDEVWLQ